MGNRSGGGVGQVVWVETVSSQLLGLDLGLGLGLGLGLQHLLCQDGEVVGVGIAGVDDRTIWPY